MHLTLVHVHVKAEAVAAFVEATHLNHAGSRREPGNLRFDILQSEDDPTRFLFVEAFRDADAAAAHKQTPHYFAWRDTVAAMMASPREGKRWRQLAPVDAS